MNLSFKDLEKICSNYRLLNNRIDRMIKEVKSINNIGESSKIIYLLYVMRFEHQLITHEHLESFKDINMVQLERYINALNNSFTREALKPFRHNSIVLEAFTLKFLLNNKLSNYSIEELSVVEKYLLTGLYDSRLRHDIISQLVTAYKQLNERFGNTEEDIYFRLFEMLFEENYIDYNFKHHYINKTLFITSKYDKWYCDLNFYNNQIILYHCNKKYDTSKYHHQKTFKNKFATIENILKYIQNHDKYIMNDRYNYDKLTTLLFAGTNKKRVKI